MIKELETFYKCSKCKKFAKKSEMGKIERKLNIIEKLQDKEPQYKLICLNCINKKYCKNEK
ncbi:MAG: hypothetical protein ABEK36_05310 [Candidatus Aenigmatarchaeota archaeon]